MSDMKETDLPPLEPQPFVTEEGREIERLRAELASMEKKRDRAIKQRDKANENLREACKLISRSHYRWTRKWPWEIAAERGWKCFKKGDGA